MDVDIRFQLKRALQKPDTGGFKGDRKKIRNSGVEKRRIGKDPREDVRAEESLFLKGQLTLTHQKLLITHCVHIFIYLFIN